MTLPSVSSPQNVPGVAVTDPDLWQEELLEAVRALKYRLMEGMVEHGSLRILPSTWVNRGFPAWFHGEQRQGFILVQTSQGRWFERAQALLRITGLPVPVGPPPIPPLFYGLGLAPPVGQRSSVLQEPTKVVPPDTIRCLLYETEVAPQVKRLLKRLEDQLGVKTNLYLTTRPKRDTWRLRAFFW